MKTKLYLVALIVLIGGLILSACGGGSSEEIYLESYAATEAPAMEAPFPQQDAVGGGSAEAEKSASSSDLPLGPVYDVGSAPEDSAGFVSSHMIIKDANITLLVTDTDIAIDRATQIVGDVDGYIISTRVWYQPHYDGENYKYATISIGVPVTQFERGLSRLRGLAVKVMDETASGDDVTDQYVDLQSQLTNLEATRDRIKGFLDEAKTIDEALRINQELSNIEAQIEQIKGQMNYLQDRSAFSTITINFQPVLPELTPVPTPTPQVWNPGDTFKESSEALTWAYQGIVDFLIWFMVALVPIFAPPVFLFWLFWKILARKK